MVNLWSFYYLKCEYFWIRKLRVSIYLFSWYFFPSSIVEIQRNINVLSQIYNIIDIRFIIWLDRWKLCLYIISLKFSSACCKVTRTRDREQQMINEIEIDTYLFVKWNKQIKLRRIRQKQRESGTIERDITSGVSRLISRDLQTQI